MIKKSELNRSLRLFRGQQIHSNNNFIATKYVKATCTLNYWKHEITL